MKIIYIGGGFVGACSAAVSADSGHEVLVYDVDANKMNKFSTDDRDLIESCIHEEGLGELIIRNRSRLTFTADKNLLAAFVNGVEAIFMCLPTPEKEGAEGESDLSYYEQAVEILGPMLAARDNGGQLQRVVVINKSTVPVRMIDYTRELFERKGVKNFGIVSNPEFLVEGKAVEDSIHPNRVVVGASSEEDFAIMRRLYQRFYDATGIPCLEVNPYEAAAAKLVANFLLFNKVVTTYDVVGRLCEVFPHIQFEKIRKVLVADPRIGSWGLYDSLYSGGSCFIKDAGSLAHQLEQAGARAPLVRGILEANVFQRDNFFGRAESEGAFEWGGKSVAVLGVAFKQNTNDIRNSGAIGIVQQLLGAGATSVRVYDPAAMEECKKYFNTSKNELYKKIVYTGSESEALENSDACVICTDWPQFKTLGSLFLKENKKNYLIMDGRRAIQNDYEKLIEAGYTIIAVGSPLLKK